MNRYNTHWTEGYVAELRLLWAQGFSAAKISEHFDGAFTRNAIIGKVYRLKLPHRKPEVVAVRRARARKPKPPKPDDIRALGRACRAAGITLEFIEKLRTSV